MYRFLKATNPNISDPEIFIIHTWDPMALIQVVLPGHKSRLKNIAFSKSYPVQDAKAEFTASLAGEVEADKIEKIVDRAYHWFTNLKSESNG